MSFGCDVMCGQVHGTGDSELFPYHVFVSAISVGKKKEMQMKDNRHILHY